jgi:hypothetical protein
MVQNRCANAPRATAWSNGLRMPRQTKLRDPRVLLCERCGYDLTGTPGDSACGECGTPVRESLPQRRIGTPFQRTPGAVGFVRTIGAIARRPRAVWGDVRIEASRSTMFGVACLVLTSIIAWIGVASTSIGRDVRTLNGAIAFLVTGTAILALLTAIEFIGLQLIGRKNGWRVNKAVSAAVCGHAAAGWIIAGLGIAIGWRLGSMLPARPLLNRVPDWMNPIVTSLQFTLPGAGFFAGMMVFETLAYLGVRRCRWANRT